MVTKLINQKAFVNQLNNEISDYRNKIAFIGEEVKPKIKFINDFEFTKDCETIGKWLDSHKYYINPDCPPSLEKVYEIAQGYPEVKNISMNAFEKEYNGEYLAEVRKMAEKLVDNCIKDSHEIENIDIKNPPVALDLYETLIQYKEYKFMAWSIFEEKYKKHIEKKKEEKLMPFGLAEPMNFADLLNMKAPSEMEVMSRSDIAIERITLEKYSNYKDEIATKNAQISSYEGVISEKMKLLESSKEIPTLKINFFLLFIFSILGVFLPLYMLLLDEKTMIEYRFLTFCLMFVGWLFIITYIVLEICWLTGYDLNLCTDDLKNQLKRYVQKLPNIKNLQK